MLESQNTVEQKLADAARLIEEAGLQLEKVGLEIDFEIKIKNLPTVSSLAMAGPDGQEIVLSGLSGYEE